LCHATAGEATNLGGVLFRWTLESVYFRFSACSQKDPGFQMYHVNVDACGIIGRLRTFNSTIWTNTRVQAVVIEHIRCGIMNANVHNLPEEHKKYKLSQSTNRIFCTTYFQQNPCWNTHYGALSTTVLWLKCGHCFPSTSVKNSAL
jgi:hypothetical protein